MSGATFVNGGDRIQYTPTEDVSAGDVVVQGNLAGVAVDDIPAGRMGTLYIEGAFTLPRKNPALGGFSTGRKLFWDYSTDEILVSGGANRILIGYAMHDGTQSPQPIDVKLSPSMAT